MECRRGLAMRILSFRLSVGLSNACIVTKGKKDLSRFLYYTKDHLVYFLRRMVGGGDPV